MGSTLRRTPWSAWPGLLLATLRVIGTSVLCIWAWALVPSGLGAIVTRALSHVDPERARDESAHWRAGFATLVLVTIPLVLGVLGARAARALGLDASAEALACLATAALAGAACAPALLTPQVLVSGEPDLAAVLTRASELAVRSGPSRIAALGALAGALIGALPAASALSPSGALATALVFVSWAMLVVPTLALVLARAHADACERPSFDAGREPRASAGVRAAFWLAAPAALTLALMLAVVPLAPTAMRATWPWRPSVAGAIHGASAVRLPRTDVLVRRTVDSVEITDARGALTVVRVCGDARPLGSALHVRALDGTYEVLTEERACSLQLDREGRRLDDTWAHRISSRLPPSALAAALVATIALAVLVHRTRRARTLARLLDVPAWSPERKQQGRARVAARLVLAPGAYVSIESDALRVESDARDSTEGEARLTFDEGQRTVLVPDGAPTIAFADATLADGSEVLLVATLPDADPMGPRQGAVPWPDDAIVLPFDHDAVAERVLGRASREHALVVLLLAASLLAASVAIALQL